MTPTTETDGLTPIDPFPRLSSSGAFVSRDSGGERFRVRYYHRPSDDAVVSKVWFGPGTEGPPGHAHGGSVAAVLDETMGGAAWHAGYPVVAARLTIDFREMVPIGAEVLAEGNVERIEGRKITTRGRLIGETGRIYAEGSGLFIVLEPEQLTRLAGFGREQRGDRETPGRDGGSGTGNSFPAP